MVLKSLAKDWTLLLLGLLIGATAGLATLWIRSGALTAWFETLAETRSLGVGDPAPDFELPQLGGERVRLSDFAGKPVVLNFWATWCGPCRLEMPILNAYAHQYGNALTILAVNLQEPEREVAIFANELGLDFPILLDGQASVSELYRVQGLPTTFVIDGEGRVVVVHVGGLSRTQLENYLAKVGIRDD